MSGIKSFFTNSRWYKRFIEWSKSAVLPGFAPLPLHTVASFFFKEIAKESLITRASSLAYSFLLAIFPGIIFLCNLIPYLPFDGFQDKLLSSLGMVLPHNAYITAKSTLVDIIKKQNGGLLSFGFFAALFFSTNGINSLMRNFNKSTLQVETRGPVKQRMVAIFLTIIVVTALILGMATIALGEFIISKIRHEIHINEWFWLNLVALLRWCILALFYFTAISILYRYGPAHAKRWRLFSPGAWLATVLTILTSWGFTYYINHFGNYNKVYGSIGTLIVIMIWMFLNSLIIMIGFELNASIDVSKQSVRIIKKRYNSFKKHDSGNTKENSTKNK